MATSGTSSFNPTFDDIMQDAAGMVGGGPILAEELASARRGMDYLLTQIQNKNVLLHKIETTTVEVTAATQEVSLPASILDAHHILVRDTNDVDMAMVRLGFEQWADIADKAQTGRPTQYWFDRRLDSNTLHLWPIPDINYSVVLTIQKTTDDTLRAFNNVDVPRRFLPALLYGLAYYVGLRRMNRVPADRLMLLKAEYENAVREAMREDRERASTYIRLQR
jgi:hypothetical protein